MPNGMVFHYNAKAIAAARTNGGQNVVWAPIALPLIGGSYRATARGGDSVVAFSTADARVSGLNNQVVTEVIVYDLSVLGGLLTADEVRVKVRVTHIAGNTNFEVTGVNPAGPDSFYRNLFIDGIRFNPAVFETAIASGIAAGPAAIQAHLNAVRPGQHKVLRGHASFYSTLTQPIQPPIGDVGPAPSQDHEFAFFNASFGQVYLGEWFVESNRQRVTAIHIRLSAQFGGGGIVIADPDGEEYPYP